MALSRGSKWFVVFCVLALGGVGLGLLWLDDRLTLDTVEAGQPVELTVERGETVRSVGDRLAELGVIGSAIRFRVAAGDRDLASRLQPGVFHLETGMSIDDAIEVLLAGPEAPAGLRFTVQEGLSVELTLERLAAQFDQYDVEDFRAVLDERTEAGENAAGTLQIPDWIPEPAEAGDEVLEPYEGVLFPQTYEVDQDATPLQILQRMVDQLTRVVDRLDQDLIARAEARGLDLYEVLIVASLIERETRVDAERQTVAGVIMNRLEEGMRLQIDATVLYARGEHTERVLFEDTEIDSPYNTYRVAGLPPTPIAGVGEASLLAALQPEDHTLRYYVLHPDCDGSHVFAETLEEHNRNVAAFREAGGCR